jgi:hypothetical protein
MLTSIGLESPLFYAMTQDLDFDPKQQRKVALRFMASITGAWTSSEENLVEALNDLHILGPDFLTR